MYKAKFTQATALISPLYDSDSFNIVLLRLLSTMVPATKISKNHDYEKKHSHLTNSWINIFCAKVKDRTIT